MKNVVIATDETPKRKYRWSKRDKVLLGWTCVNLLLSFCLSIYSIITKWGNGTLALVWLSFLAALVAAFAVMLIFSSKKSAKDIRYKLKDSIAGFKILTNLSNLINISLSLSMLIIASVKGDMPGTAVLATLIVFLLFALFGIIFNINGIIKRRLKNKKGKKRTSKIDKNGGGK